MTLDAQRQQLQWTAGVVLEWLLTVWRATPIGGGTWEPADFFPGLPRRWAPAGDPDGRDTLRTMLFLTAAAGGTVPPHVAELLEES